MDNGKFTPGPHYAVEYAGFWNIQRQPEYDSKDNLLDVESDDRAEHNAKLYAAAPSMYEFIKSVAKGQDGELMSEFINRIRKKATKLLSQLSVGK